MTMIMQSFQTITKMTECMILVQELVLVLCHKLNDKEQDSELQQCIDKIKKIKEKLQMKNDTPAE